MAMVNRQDRVILMGLGLVAAGLLVALGLLLAGAGQAAPLVVAGSGAAAYIILLWHGARLTRRLDAAQRALDRHRVRFEQEMALAAEVHNSLIPPSTRQAGPFRIDVRYVPLERIGGDIVAYHVDAERGVARIGVGDVTGHGVAAALLVNRIHHEAEDLLRLAHPPGEILRRINRLVWRTFSGTEMLMTFTVMEVDAVAGRVTWANGGHPPPLLWHAETGAISLLAPQATLLGVSDDLGVDPLDRAETIRPRDRIILHTDGLIDALDAEGRRFGMDRLIALVGEILADCRESPAGDRVPDADRTGAEIIERVRQFARGLFEDDVLVVTVALDAG